MLGLRQDIARFLAFQFTRGPAVRAALEEHFTTMAMKLARLITPEAARDALREDGVEPSDEEIEGLLEFARNPKLKATIAKEDRTNLHLQSAFPSVAETSDLLFRRHWQILEFDDPLLLTGDEPVACVGPSQRSGEEVGLGNANEAVVATDPHHALVLVRPDRISVERVSKGTPRMARLINRHVAFGCYRFIVHRPGTNPLVDLDLPEKGPAVVVDGDRVLLRPHPPALHSSKRPKD